MSEFLPYLIIGITVGSIYGLSAMGLVLTYKTSGVFNLAHGSIGAGAAYLFLELRQRHGMSWPLALVVSVLVFGVLVGLVMERLAEGLARVPAVYRIVATVGLLVADPRPAGPAVRHATADVRALPVARPGDNGERRPDLAGQRRGLRSGLRRGGDPVRPVPLHPDRHGHAGCGRRFAAVGHDRAVPDARAPLRVADRDVLRRAVLASCSPRPNRRLTPSCCRS